MIFGLECQSKKVYYRFMLNVQSKRLLNVYLKRSDRQTDRLTDRQRRKGKVKCAMPLTSLLTSTKLYRLVTEAHHHHHHHHHARVASEGRRVVASPRRPTRLTARLQMSPVGRVKSFRSWSSHLFRRRPGGRRHVRSGLRRSVE